MAELKGSETEKNLLKAFEGEAIARVKYSIYANQAKAEGYDYVSKVFEELARNEQEHAKVWMKWALENGIPKTFENLQDAVTKEHQEWTEMYTSFARTARKEELDHIADLFEHIIQVEKNHEEKLLKLLMLVKNKDLKPDSNGNYRWECSNCGCMIEDKEQPTYCPLCAGEDIFFFKRY